VSRNGDGEGGGRVLLPYGGRAQACEGQLHGLAWFQLYMVTVDKGCLWKGDSNACIDSGVVYRNAHRPGQTRKG
jgi:hypothetical protein